jgi:hypothetical protein
MKKYPIEQSDIDKAIEKIKQRKLMKSQVEPVKTKKMFRGKFYPKRDQYDKMLDYAIWKDK